jgi:hypothetical protein
MFNIDLRLKLIRQPGGYLTGNPILSPLCVEKSPKQDQEQYQAQKYAQEYF